MIKITDINNSEPYILFNNLYNKALIKNQKNIEAISVSSFDRNLNEVQSRYVNLKYLQDNKWILRDRRTVINDIVDKSYNILDDEYLKTLEDGDSEKTHFNDFQNDYEKKNKSVDKKLKKEAELIIRNGTNSFNNVNNSNK